MAIIADAVVSALITGELSLNGKSIQLDPKEWIDLFKYASIHVDGPAKEQIEHSGAIKLIEVDIVDDDGSDED